jgi:hypothetical protein
MLASKKVGGEVQPISKQKRRFGRLPSAPVLLPVSAFGLGLPRPYGPQGRVRAASRSSGTSSRPWRLAAGTFHTRACLTNQYSFALFHENSTWREHCYLTEQISVCRALGGPEGALERRAGRPRPKAIGADRHRGEQPSPKGRRLEAPEGVDRPERSEGNAQFYFFIFVQ